MAFTHTKQHCVARNPAHPLLEHAALVSTKTVAVHVLTNAYTGNTTSVAHVTKKLGVGPAPEDGYMGRKKGHMSLILLEAFMGI